MLIVCFVVCVRFREHQGAPLPVEMKRTEIRLFPGRRGSRFDSCHKSCRWQLNVLTVHRTVIHYARVASLRRPLQISFEKKQLSEKSGSRWPLISCDSQSERCARAVRLSVSLEFFLQPFCQKVFGKGCGGTFFSKKVPPQSFINFILQYSYRNNLESK